MRPVWALAFLLLASLAGRAAPDEIDHLVAGLVYDPEVGLWENGVWPVVDLGADAAPAQVVAAFVQTQAGVALYDQQYRNYTVVEVKQTSLGDVTSQPFTGVQIASAAGCRTIFLIRYQADGWRVRPFCLGPAPAKNKLKKA
jgi:hypothetical protein